MTLHLLVQKSSTLSWSMCRFCFCFCKRKRRNRSISKFEKMNRPPTIDRPKLHDRPIIGIMAVVSNHSLGQYALPAAYVNSVEASGARVSPVLPGQSEAYYRKSFEKLNGLLIPGGQGAPTGTQKKVSDAVSLFYKWSIAAYDEKSVYWPIWGTCLGFEMLLDITEGMSGTLLSRCNMPERSFPLDLTAEAKNTRMIASLPPDLLQAVSNSPVFPHLHAYCVTVDRFRELELDQFYTVVGTNDDVNGIVYVSAIEARNGYPMYAVMGHPEKTLYSWSKRFEFDRSSTSIRMAQHWMNFFVQECCKNDHHFADVIEEREASIYNHTPIFTGKQMPQGITEQCYYFN